MGESSEEDKGWIKQIYRTPEGKEYEIGKGIPSGDLKRGAQPRDESVLVKQYIKGRVSGVYKTHVQAAREITEALNDPSADYNTHVDRLSRKFGRAWKQHLNGEKVTII